MSETFVDYQTILILSIEVSNKSWVLAAQVPGLPHTKAKRSISPEAEAFAESHTLLRQIGFCADCRCRQGRLFTASVAATRLSSSVTETLKRIDDYGI
jgi:hypothetical protein